MTIIFTIVGRKPLEEMEPNPNPNPNPLQYFCLENPMDGGAW